MLLFIALFHALLNIQWRAKDVILQSQLQKLYYYDLDVADDVMLTNAYYFISNLVNWLPEGIILQWCCFLQGDDERDDVIVFLMYSVKQAGHIIS